MLVTASNKKYNKFVYRFELQLSMKSNVILDEEELQVLPLNKFNFKSLFKINNCERETIVGE